MKVSGRQTKNQDVGGNHDIPNGWDIMGGAIKKGQETITQPYIAVLACAVSC
jgi:hypothetical protein